MNVSICLGSRLLVLKPETSFEEDVLCKFFQDKKVIGRKAIEENKHCLHLYFSGGAALKERKED